jgi:hypothetical protein
MAAKDAAENSKLSHIQSRGSTAGFELVNFPNPLAVAIPMWFPILLAAGTAWVCSLGFRHRYSLRALLVAMTLIAVVLATMAYLRVW